MFTTSNKVRFGTIIGGVVVFGFLAWRFLMLPSDAQKIRLRGINIQSPVHVHSGQKWMILISGCSTCAEASIEARRLAEESFALLLENRGSAEWIDLNQISTNFEDAAWRQLETELGKGRQDFILLATPEGRVIVAHPLQASPQDIAADLRNLIFADMR